MSVPKFIYAGESEKEAAERTKRELFVAYAELDNLEPVASRLASALSERITANEDPIALGAELRISIARYKGVVEYVIIDSRELVYFSTNGLVTLKDLDCVYAHATPSGTVCVHFADGYVRTLTRKGELSDPHTCYIVDCGPVDLDLTPQQRKELHDECALAYKQERVDLKIKLRLLKNYLTIHKLRATIRMLGQEPPAV